jgi:soluble lytic murein transglycosylase-like protein
MRQIAVMLVCIVLAYVCGFAMKPAMAFGRAALPDQNACDAAAIAAAERTGVPSSVLFAISRVESGRQVDGQFAPWPWAVNQAGTGTYFDTPDAAMAHVAQAMALGRTNIDIGCFQINIRWHGDQFSSLSAMFEPKENALYAAQFLLRLYDEFGSWESAIGAYHSRQTGPAAAYLSKVYAHLDTPPTMTTLPAVTPQAPRDNRYPLLQSGQTRGYGSLVATASDHPRIPLFR